MNIAVFCGANTGRDPGLLHAAQEMGRTIAQRGLGVVYDGDRAAQDWRDASALFDLIERQVVPMFHERDADGIPQRWVAMVKRSLMTLGPRFSAARMVREYAERIYRRG